MAYDSVLAERVRDALALEPDVGERKMFGGLCFMVGDHMACGVLKQDLIVRVAPEEHDSLVARPHVRAFDFTGRPMKGMVYVGPGATATDGDLRGWIDRAVAHARTRPPKK
jgi:TfoX/Sxy family transcriptional regulator of competence genes